MRNLKPNGSEIEYVRDIIRASEFPRLIHFADMVGRYVKLRFKGKIDYLSASILILLTIRGPSMNPSELAQLMLRSSYGLTQLLDRLEKDGLVVRHHDKKDRRTVNVTITSAGLAYLVNTLSHNEVIEKEVMSVLNNDEIEQLRNIIRKLREPLMIKRGGQ